MSTKPSDIQFVRCDSSMNPIVRKSLDLSTKTSTPTLHGPEKFSSTIPVNNCNIYLVVMFGAIGGALFGMDQASFAGVIPKASFINAFCNNATDSSGSWGSYEACDAVQDHVPIPPEWTNFQAWGSSLIQLGAAAGVIGFAPFLTRHYGRRACVWGGGVTVCVCLLGLISSRTIQIRWFYLARFGTGIGIGLVMFALPIWIAEIAPTSIRGALGCTTQVASVSGTIMAACINLPMNVSWRLSLGAPLLPAIILTIGVFCFPESPRFLIKQGHMDKAKRSLRRLRGHDQVEEELHDITSSLHSEMCQRQAPWSTLWSDPSIRSRLLLACGLQWMQQFAGINAIVGQGPKLFIKAGVPVDGNTAYLLTNMFKFAGVLTMMGLIDKRGRRPLLLIGAVGMAVGLLSSAGFAQYWVGGLGGWFLLMFVSVFLFSYTMAWGGIPWVYPSEIFPMDVKEKALSVSVTCQWVANFLVAQITPRQIDVWGATSTFMFYGLFVVLSGIVVYLCVPEIKGVPLESMDLIFGARQFRTAYDREQRSDEDTSEDFEAGLNTPQS